MHRKIGIAIPCHVDDLSRLKTCQQSIARLQPKPYKVAVCVNNGEHSLWDFRVALFEQLFAEGCDVVVSCDADFYLMPHVLRYVSVENAVSFQVLSKRFSDVVTALIGLLYPRSWTGLYSLPKDVWDGVKDRFDGTDGSVHKALNGDYRFVKKPSYYSLRGYREENVNRLLRNMSLSSKIKWRLLRCR